MFNTEYVEQNGRIFQLHWKYRFDPVTMAIVAGAGMQAYGQLEAGKAAAEQGKQEQMILEHNAKLKEREAELEVKRARAEATRFGKEGKVFQAAQRVGYAKSGVLATQDTPALSLEQTAIELDVDRMSILEEGFLAESFRLSEAGGLRFEGRAARERGRAARRASRMQAAGTILSGIGSAYKPQGTNYNAKTRANYRMVESKGGPPTSTTGGYNRPTVTRTY